MTTCPAPLPPAEPVRLAELAYVDDLRAVADIDGAVGSTLFVMLTTLTSLAQLAAPQTRRDGPRHLTVATPLPKGAVRTHTITLARSACAAIGAGGDTDSSGASALHPHLFPGEYLPHAVARRLDTRHRYTTSLDLNDLRRRALGAVAADPRIGPAGVTSYLGLHKAAHPLPPDQTSARDLLHERVAQRIDHLVAAAGFTF